MIVRNPLRSKANKWHRTPFAELSGNRVARIPKWLGSRRSLMGIEGVFDRGSLVPPFKFDIEVSVHIIYGPLIVIQMIVMATSKNADGAVYTTGLAF